MTRELSHSDARELVALHALDALAGEEHAAIQEHISRCPECQSEIAALRDASGLLPYTAPVRPMNTSQSARLRSRLLARAAADSQASRDSGSQASPGILALQRPAGESTPSRRERRSGAWLLAAALAFAALGIGAYAVILRRQSGTLGDRLATTEATLQSTTGQLAQRDSMLSGLLSPSVQVVELTATGPQPPSARMFWNQATDTWTFVAHNLPEAGVGRTYQLWLITPDQRKLSAGVFVPNAQGTAVVRAQFALARDSLLMVAVTEEPAGGVPQPTGSIVLAGKAD
ncbi:MAG: anti-sigma factor domain-containing protein [Gemmatimonadaceae bacterium]